MVMKRMKFFTTAPCKKPNLEIINFFLAIAQYRKSHLV